MDNFHLIMEELKNHKIKYAIGIDILRWGHEPKGTFTTKESYHLLVHNGYNPQGPNWNKIWSLKNWPKIHTFLSLLRHKRTLTWDNIMKSGFKGPSQCVMCYKQEENIRNLFYLCPLANLLWDKVSILCHKSQRTRGNIVNTLDSWTNHSFQTPLLNLLSQLILAFLLWEI